MQSGITQFVLLLVISLNAWSAHAGLYRFVDEDGQVHYSDQKPAAADFKTVEIKLSASAPTSNMSKKKPGKGVVIYTSSTCGYCKQAKAWLRQKKVLFTERNITTSRSARREYDKLGARGVPVILVGKQRLNGFSASRLQAALDAR